MKLLNDKGPVQAPNILIRGTYIELVDSELIGKQKELLVDTVWEVPGSRQMLGVGLWGLSYIQQWYLIIYLFIYYHHCLMIAFYNCKSSVVKFTLTSTVCVQKIWTKTGLTNVMPGSAQSKYLQQ